MAKFEDYMKNRRKKVTQGGPKIPQHPDGDVTNLGGSEDHHIQVEVETPDYPRNENSNLINRIQRQKDITPLGTTKALEQLEFSCAPYLCSQFPSKRHEHLESLGFTREMADTISRNFPDLQYVVPISINTCNTLAFAMDPRGIFALKRTDLRQGMTEDALLRILAQAEFSELKDNIPLLYLSKEYYDGNYLIATQVGKPQVLDTDAILEERMRTIGLLHGYSPKIKEQLRKKGISLGKKDFGNIDNIIAQMNSQGEIISPFFTDQLREAYPQCVDFLRRHAQTQLGYVVDMDTKDENWVAGGATKIDLAVAKEDEAKHYDYSRVLFDELCQTSYSGSRTDLVKIALQTENSVLPEEHRQPVNIGSVDTNIFLTMTAGIVDLPRLIASNVTKGKTETNQTNLNYMHTLKRLMTIRKRSLPSYSHLVE